MTGNMSIEIKSDMDTYALEMLEDKIRNLLEREGIDAEILDQETGNTTVTSREEMEKTEKDNGLPDQNIKGTLILGEKVWFNDDLRCRLRICGFSKEQIEQLRNAKFIDLTITDYTDKNTPGVVIHIGEFGSDRSRDGFGF